MRLKPKARSKIDTENGCKVGAIFGLSGCIYPTLVSLTCKNLPLNRSKFHGPFYLLHAIWPYFLTCFIGLKI